jgi:hypothetical protein
MIEDLLRTLQTPNKPIELITEFSYIYQIFIFIYFAHFRFPSKLVFCFHQIN